MMAESSGKQSRYYDLRNRLSDAKYSGVFGIDSLDTVEELFSDLQASAEAYKQCQEREARLSADLTLAQSQLFPLRKENAKLARENYQLHIDNVKIKDEGATAVAQKAMQAKRIEDLVSELKLLVEFKDKQLAESESVKGKIRDAYESLAGAALKTGPKVKAHMKVSAQLGGAPIPIPTMSVPLASREEAGVMESLRSQVDVIQMKLTLVEEQNLQLKASVTARENELTRHARDVTTNDGALSGSRMEQLVAADSANQRIIDQLNSQVDFLNEQLAFGEQVLVGS